MCICALAALGYVDLCIKNLPILHLLDIIVFTQDGYTALTLASGECGTETIVELVRAGADVNLQANVCWCCV